MAVYNGEKYLRQAVDSILGQTFRDFEFIIVDDGSTDGTAGILQSYSDPRIVFVRNSENLGLVRSLNRALEISKQEYVARMDADDVAMPQRLKRQICFLDHHPEVAVVGSDCLVINESGKKIGRVSMPCSDVIIKWHSLFLSPFVHSSVVFRAAAVRQAGGYSTAQSAQYIEDFELWTRLSLGHEFANIPEPLVSWRSQPSSISFQHIKQQSENFTRLVQFNLNALSKESGFDDRRCMMLWFLQVGSGLTVSPEGVNGGLEDLERLLSDFCREHRLTKSSKEQIRRMAHHRAARTILRIAEDQSYSSNLSSGQLFARKALQLDPELRLAPSYLWLRLKFLLGPRFLRRLITIRRRLLV